MRSQRSPRRAWLFTMVIATSAVASGCDQARSIVTDAVATATNHSATVPAEPAGPAPIPELRFLKKPPVVGQTAEVTETTVTKISVNIGAKTTNVDAIESQIKKTVVLATSGNAATKMKITYLRKRKSETKDGKGDTKESPVTGKTYFGELKGGKVVVTSAGGASVPANEATVVAKDLSDLGKPDPILIGLPDTALHAGDNVNVLASAIRERLSSDSKNLDVSDTTVSLRAIRARDTGREGIFDIDMTVADHKGPGMRMVLHGELVVRAQDGRTTSLTLAGPLTMGDTANPKKPSGRGDVTMSETANLD